jgi:hypothetical protein
LNRKAAKFTPEEREKLAFALKDISQKIHDVALLI